VRPVARLLAALVVLSSFSAVRGTQAQEIVRSDDERAPLENRWEWALEQAEGRFVVGYAMVGMTTSGWMTGGGGISLGDLLGEPVGTQTHVAVLVRFQDAKVEGLKVLDSRSTFQSEASKLFWLGDASQQDSFELLQSLALTDDAEQNRAYVLGSHRAVPEAGMVLRRLLESSGRDDLRKAAAYGYGRFAGSEALPLLKRTAVSDRSDEVAKAATYAVSNVDNDEAITTLESILADSNRQEVKKAAVYGLGNIGTDRARRVLLGLILKEG
jgi:HEAT repeat protein